MSGADILLPGWPVKRPPPRIAAVMQPYFLPYPGYFALMQYVNAFILDDLARYTPKRWMNRNRLRTLDGGWQYFTLSVAHAPVRTPICQIQIAPENWKCRLFGRLTAYTCAPNYAVVCCLLKGFVQSDIALLREVNKRTLRVIAEYLDIDTPIYLLSRLNLPDYCPPYPKGENALAVCQVLRTVEEYCNLPGGSAFYLRQPYRAAGPKPAEFPPVRMRCSVSAYNKSNSEKGRRQNGRTQGDGVAFQLSACGVSAAGNREYSRPDLSEF